MSTYPEPVRGHLEVTGTSYAQAFRRLARELKRLRCDPEVVDVVALKDHEEAPWPVIRLSALIET